jgi:hypothetical protein
MRGLSTAASAAISPGTIGGAWAPTLTASLTWEQEQAWPSLEAVSEAPSQRWDEPPQPGERPHLAREARKIHRPQVCPD